jgi:subtilisin family serine protease
VSALPSNAAFEGIRGATPWLPMAPERIRRGVPREPFDAPEQVLRRLVLLRFPGSTNAAERRQRLIASGWFNRVEPFVPGRQTARPAQSGTDPLANDEPYGQPDPDPDLHRWQWALETIRAPGDAGAWHFTLGRAQVASLDGGLQPDHPDVEEGPLSNFRAHQSARIRWFMSQQLLEPALVGQNLETNPYRGSFLNHGIHVNTLMAAPRNTRGIAGVCPECTLQTFKVESGSNGVDVGGVDGDFLLFATYLAARFGSTAINHSFEAFAGSPFYAAAIDAAVARDVVLVAAAGNDGRQRPDWNFRLPHGNAAVIKVGATDRFDFLWRETTIVNRIFAYRHPVAFPANASCPDPNDPAVCVRRRILDRCDVPSELSQCGSNIGTPNTSSVVTMVAPGAQVIGGMMMAGQAAPVVYQTAPILLSSSLPPGLPPELLELLRNTQAVPPSETGLGVGFDGVKVWNSAVSAHGPATGTSMATPHVTATVGLMRSINPLLGAQAVRLGLTQRAKKTDLPEFYEVRRMGQGLLDARHAVEDATGQVRGVRLRNRLAPMFSMYAAQSQIQSEAAEGEFFGSAPIHSWLFTTNPQLASAAIKGDIYYSGVFGAPAIPAQAQFGPTVTAAYVHGHLVTLPGPLGLSIPDTVYELPAGAGNGKLARTPAASFWIFTTPHSPLPGFSLQPLYRLTTDMTVESGSALLCAGDQRKHLYSTDVAEVTARTSAAHDCNLVPMLMRYHFESIEGYVYDRAGPQPPGTFPLFRVFNTNPGFNVAALVVQGESLPGYSAPGAADASNNPHFLGWVYRTFQPTQSGVGIEAADLDQDGLPNGVEIALGLNEQSANGDCEGPNDAVEYGFANLPDDPMSPAATCTDGRLTAAYNAGLQSVTVTLSNPVGPVALPVETKVMVYFTAPAQGPIVLMGGGGSQCQSIATIGWDAAYECTLSAALPVGPNSSIVWQWTNVGGPLFQPGQNVAAITVIPGLSDPVSGNNSRNF